MYIHADINKNSDKYEPIDLDTGKSIPRVKWMDDEKGEYCIYKYKNNEPCRNSDGKIIIEIKKGNVKLIKKIEEN